MTSLRDAAQQALELCDRINDEREIWGQHELRAVCEALRAALAESPDSTKPVAESEPVAWMDREGDLYKMPEIEGWAPPHTMLYPAPLNLNDPAVQKRLAAQWGYVKAEPLTDDEIAQAMYRADAIVTGPMQFRFARAIEQAHGIGGEE